MHLLLLSSSKEGQGGYLEHALPFIQLHLGSIKNILFIPYAGVSLGWDEYTQRVQQALADFNIQGIHQTTDPITAINQAQAIMVGGGNTFALLNHLYQKDLLNVIKQRVNANIPYIGWSAGSNIAGSSIRTTNDMPIIQPPSFDALKLMPFQINPHYSDVQAPGHHGETRAQRIQEFTCLNPNMPVIALREGSALQRNGNQLTLLGNRDGLVFLDDKQQTIKPASNLDHYLVEQYD
ncbi:dipeptidase PepE [Alteromonadaceae bacterium BrNp21-10]|nr:dipeptidase PepE [Alteromonadaceae bacterium BrNp21-10]